jgi:hypothetical protein
VRTVAQEKPKFTRSVVYDSVQVDIETETLGAWYVLILLTIELRTFKCLNSSNSEFLRYDGLLNVGTSLRQVSKNFKVFLSIVSLVLQPSSRAIEDHLEGFQQLLLCNLVVFELSLHGGSLLLYSTNRISQSFTTGLGESAQLRHLFGCSFVICSGLDVGLQRDLG